MKSKLLLGAWLLFALMPTAFGQKSFQSGNNIINGGVGFAGIKWKGVSYNGTFEHAVTNNFGAGAHFGYSQYSKSGYKYTAYIFGVRASYHFLTTEKADPYAGAELGFASISHTGHNETLAYKTYPKTGLGVYGGVRYYLTPATAVYGELRLSAFAVINLGISLKF